MPIKKEFIHIANLLQHVAAFIYNMKHMTVVINLRNHSGKVNLRASDS